MIEQPHTHPAPETISRAQASPQAKRLVERLRDVLRNEEAWAIADEALGEAFQMGRHR